jgi:hypothetical protein
VHHWTSLQVHRQTSASCGSSGSELQSSGLPRKDRIKMSNVRRVSAGFHSSRRMLSTGDGDVRVVNLGDERHFGR